MVAPAAVPALPDTERRTRYSGLSDSTGPFDVGFAVFGDSSDYAQWIEVWLDGEKLTSGTHYTVDSPSGSLSTLARPITDLRVTPAGSYIDGFTGTIDIVGARRPRRTTQLTQGTGETARQKNQTYTDITATMREFWHRFTRTPQVAPGETIGLIPSAADRANKIFTFDSEGDPDTTSAATTNLIASQAVAEAGTDNTYLMTALRTAQSILAHVERWAGRAIAISPAGIMISDPIVTERARYIRRVYEDSGAICVQFYSEHDYTSSDTICIRADGWHPSTWRKHPAYGDWAITVVDANTIKLTGSTWVSTPYECDTTFLHGLAYVQGSKVDARPELTRLLYWLHENGGGSLVLPRGVMMLQSRDPLPGPNTILWIKGHTRITGQGQGHSILFVDDDTEGFGLQVGDDSHVTLEHFTAMGNRASQNNSSGFHLLRFGGTDIDDDNEYIVLRHLDVLGSKSYGVGWQGSNSFRHCRMEHVNIIGAGSDGTDFKARLNRGVDNHFHHVYVRCHGMLTIGTDRSAIALGADPFATTSGSPIVTVTAPSAGERPRIGQYVSFSGAAAVAGLDLNRPNGGWVVASTPASDTFTIDVGANANATTSGGGAVAILSAPDTNAADNAIDTRGHGVVVSDCRVVIEFPGLNGLHLRSGLPDDAINGEGANFCTVSNISVQHTQRYDNISTSGVVIDSYNVTLAGVNVEGASRGILQVTTSEHVVISGAVIHNCTWAGMSLWGKDTVVNGGSVDDCAQWGIQIGAESGATNARNMHIRNIDFRDNLTNIHLDGAIDSGTCTIQGCHTEGHTNLYTDDLPSTTRVLWGPGNTGGFLNLPVFDTLTVSGEISVSISADQNNYAPTGFSTAHTIGIDGGAADRTITGLAGGVAGLQKKIINRGATNNLIFPMASGSSSAGNQFAGPATVTIPPGASWVIQYHGGTDTKWRANHSLGGGDVVGPSSATDNALPRFDGAGGKTLQGSTATINDEGKLSVALTDAATNAVSPVLRLTHAATGTATNGIGASLEFEVENGSGVNKVGATIDAVTTDVTSGSEDFDLVFKLMAAGAAAAEKLRVLSTGVAYLAGNAARTILTAVGGVNLTGGFTATSYDNGTKSTGTFTPDGLNGNIQHYVNGGAHTLAPPANPSSIVLECTNASAGALTTSGFSVVSGDSYDSSGTKKHIFRILKTNSYSELNVTYVTGT